MASQSDLEPVRKRQRKAKSCQPCRDRKVRCDQATPCGPCQRSRDHLRCTYRDLPQDVDVPATNAGGALRPEPTKLPLPANGHHPSPSSGGWTSMNAPNSATSPNNGPTHVFNGPNVAPRPHEGVNASLQDVRIRELEARVRRLEEEAAAVAQSRSTQPTTPATDLEAGNNAANQETMIDSIAPRLRVSSEKSKLFGPSHWVHTADKVYQFGSFDAGVEPVLGFDKEEWSRICTELRRLRRAVKLLQQPANVEIPLQPVELVKTLPPFRLCGYMIMKYRETFEPIYRVLDMRQFDKEIDLFDKKDRNYTFKPIFILKLVLILAISVPFIPRHVADDDTVRELRRQARQWIYAAQWWLAGPMEKSTQNIDALQIFCLALIARQTHGLGESPALSPSSLASLAVQMGLNRNPRTFLPDISCYQIELMSRLWATITELLLASYLENGLPMSNILQGSDAEMPSNINDEELKNGLDSALLATFDSRTTDASIQLLLLRSQKLRIEALSVINSTQTRVSYEKTLDLANRLRSACTEVTKFFNERKLHSNQTDNPVDFSRKYIDMYLRKHILLLHRPFMLAALKDPRFYLSHKTCVESAMIIASYTDDCRLPAEIRDHFARLMVNGAGHVRGGLSLDVAMTLALELKRSLQEDDGHGDDDPARALSLSLRRPFLQRLKKIRDQLLWIIKQGNPSMKRFLMVSSFLAQFEALEAGSPAKPAFLDAVRRDARECVESLQSYLDLHTPQTSDASDTAAPSDDLDFDFGSTDFESFLDPLMFFDPVLWSGHAQSNIAD